MSEAGVAMSRRTAVVLWILVLLGIGVVWLMAYESGHTLGSDMAKRDNAAEAR